MVDRVGIWPFVVENARLSVTALRRGLDYTRGREYPMAYNCARLERTGPLRVLDVGAGSMSLFARVIVRRTGARVVALDARSDWSDCPSRVLRLRADAIHLPFADASFDRVTFISSIEHFSDDGDSQAMLEAARVLVPGGLCVLTTPYNQSGSTEEYRRGPIYGVGSACDRNFFERAYDDDALNERLIGPSGLREIERRYFGERGWSFERFHNRVLQGTRLSKLARVPFGLLMPILTSTFLTDFGSTPAGLQAGKAAGKGGGVVISLQRPVTSRPT